MSQRRAIEGEGGEPRPEQSESDRRVAAFSMLTSEERLWIMGAIIPGDAGPLRTLILQALTWAEAECRS